MTRTRVEVALGSIDYFEDPAFWTWSDWTDYVEREEIGVYTFRGYRDGSIDPSATEIRFRGKNADRRWSIWSAANPYYGEFRKRTPVRVSRNYGADIQRALAFVDTVSIGNEAAGAHRWADVECFGRLKFEENNETSTSVLYSQMITQSHSVAYWPGEDSAGSKILRSAVAEQPDGTNFHNIAFASKSDVIGSRPIWTMSGDDSVMQAVLRPYERPSPEEWSVQQIFVIPEEPAGTMAFFAVYNDLGTVKRWILSLVPGTPAVIKVEGLNSSNSVVSTGTTADFTDKNLVEMYGRTVGCNLRCRQVGADIEWVIDLYGEDSGGSGSSSASGTATGQTLGPVSSLYTGPTIVNPTGMSFGHWNVLNTYNSGFIYYDGFNGFNVLSLGFEVAIQAKWNAGISATPSDTTTGPLGLDGPATNLKRLAHTEGSVLFETTDGAIYLRPRALLVNQAPSLTVDFNSKQIYSLRPTEDNLRSPNRVVANNSDGTSYAADAPAPYDPATVGWVNSTPIDVNVQDPIQLRHLAEFEAAQLSYPDYRYEIEFEFDGAASALRSTFLSDVDISHVIKITNPPTDYTVDPIEHQIMGIEERMTEQSYRVKLNTRSSAVWRAFVAETGTGNLSRADTSGSRLLVGVVAADTALLVGTYGNAGDRSGKWSTTAVPYDLQIRTHDRVTCTAVTNRAATFIAAGTAAHADFAAVTPGAPAGIAAGDLDLVLASVRDSGFNYLTIDQLDYVELLRFGGSNNPVVLYGRTYVSGGSPTLTPQTGGSGGAGDTVSAQRCCIRYAQPVQHVKALSQTNASAANVAYPGWGTTRPNAVAIIVAQKDDDASAWSTPAGFTQIGMFSSTLGNDQSLAWYYQIQTTATNIVGGTLTLTGGAAAVSRAGGITLLGDVQTLTATRGVNGAFGTHPVGADVRLWGAGRLAR